MMMKIIMRTEEPIFVNLDQRYNADVEGLGGLQGNPVGPQQLHQTRHQLDGWQRKNQIQQCVWKPLLEIYIGLLAGTDACYHIRPVTIPSSDI